MEEKVLLPGAIIPDSIKFLPFCLTTPTVTMCNSFHMPQEKPLGTFLLVLEE
jgi:hypothetical protein